MAFGPRNQGSYSEVGASRWIAMSRLRLARVPHHRYALVCNEEIVAFVLALWFVWQ